MMQVLHIWSASQVEPEPMQQLHFMRFNRRSMRSDVKAERCSIRFDNIERKLAFRLRESLPRLTNVVRLLLYGELCRRTGYHGGRIQRVSRLHQSRKDIT